MPRRRPTRVRVIVRAVLVAVVAFLVLVVGAGVLLAIRLDIGCYRFTSAGPYMTGTSPVGTASYKADFVRTPVGGIYLGGPHAAAAPAGTLLGRAEFDTKTTVTGFPYQYRGDWVFTLSKIVPTADGPPATDTRAWFAIIAEGMSRTRSGARAVPAAIGRGESSGTTFSIGDFAYNAGWRLLHDPVWPGAALVLAVAIAFAVSWRSIRVLRRGPGACAACGYDRRGLAEGALCPECGAGPAA